MMVIVEDLYKKARCCHESCNQGFSASSKKWYIILKSAQCKLRGVEIEKDNILEISFRLIEDQIYENKIWIPILS